MLGIATLFGTSTGIAGDREWSTAGKILTGLVAAHVISDVVVADRGSYNRTKSRWSIPKRRSNYSCKPQKRKHRKQFYSRRNHRSTIASERSSNLHSGFVVPECDDYVIVRIENGRRIIQPRVRGVTAYLQVYSKVCNEWVTIEEYPSIW